MITNQRPFSISMLIYKDFSKLNLLKNYRFLVRNKSDHKSRPSPYLPRYRRFMILTKILVFRIKSERSQIKVLFRLECLRYEQFAFIQKFRFLV